jgi:hypothetical protein
LSSPDVVIPVRVGERNEELRYALRTIAAHLPHGRVWLAGHAPRWVQRVGHVPVRQGHSKHENSLRNLLAACHHPDISEEFILWNDDFFLLEDLPEGVPPLHRGPALHVLEGYGPRSSEYLRGMQATIKTLQRLGYDDPLSYELHVPMPMAKMRMLKTWEVVGLAGTGLHSALQPRTLYGNLNGAAGDRIEDVKIFELGQQWEPGPLPFLSTMDHLWGRHPASRAVMAAHKVPGPYEVNK